jgi:hypothetical protein
MKDFKATTDAGVLSHTELEETFEFNSVDQLIDIIRNIDLEIQSGDITFDNDSSYICFNSTDKQELMKILKNMDRSVISIDKD